MSHYYETVFQISNKEILIRAEFTLTGGCPAHMGSLSDPGHPAESPELEFGKVEINPSYTDKETASTDHWIPAPDWLVEILSEDTEVYAECCNLAGDVPDDYYED